jgi:HEAT repeat protein
VLETLTRIGREDDRLIDFFFSAQQDANGDMRRIALKGAAWRAPEDPRFVPALVAALQDRLPDVRQAAINIVLDSQSTVNDFRFRRLRQFRRGNRNPALDPISPDPDLLKQHPELRRALGAALIAALSTADGDARRQALKTLNNLHDNTLNAPGLVSTLIRAEEDANPAIRADALEALCRFGEDDPQARRVILTALRAPDLRDRAITALLKRDEVAPEVVRGLLPLLRATEDELRMNAALALLRFGRGVPEAERGAPTVLIALLQHSPNFRTREMVITQMTDWMPADTSWDALLAPLLKHGEAAIRLFAVQRLAHVAEQDPAAYAGVRAALEDADPRVRLAVIAALGELAGNRTAPLADLVPLLEDHSSEVRMVAATRIGQVADRLAADPHQVRNLILLRDVRALEMAQARVEAMGRANPADTIHPTELLPRIQHALLKLKAEARRRLGS